MKKNIEWKDTYYHSKDRIVLTSEELNIPGLSMLGKHSMTSAVAPLPDHYHKDCYEFTFVLRGAISFTVGNTDYEISGNEVFVTKPNEVHSTNLHPLSAGEIIWFQIDIKEGRNILYLDEEGTKKLIDDLENIKEHKIKILDVPLIHFIKKAFDLSLDQKNRYRTASYLSLSLLELVEQRNRPKPRVGDDMMKSLTYIREHIKEDISLDQLASTVNLSLSQFKQKFKKQIGIAPRHYINDQKIKEAKKMLMQNRSITEVAMELGFNTSSYFSIVFKRYCACSPREYMKNKKVEIPEYFKGDSKVSDEDFFR